MQDAELSLVDRSARLHAELLVWDSHAGFAPNLHPELNFLERWRAAGATYLCINIGFDIVMPWEETLQCAARYRRWIELHCDRFLMADTVADVHRAKRESKLAVAFDLE